MSENANEIVVLNLNINESTQLQPFVNIQAISGLAFSGDINLNSDSSMVRIILVDNKYNEFLVYEGYSILADKSSFTINQIGEETVILNNVIPQNIIVEIIDASIFLKELTFSTEVSVMTKSAISDKQIKQQLDKISRINNNIQKKGLKWIAGQTSVSEMTYQEKKQLFGGKVPNLQGFEYYVGGIFVLPEATLTQASISSPYVKEFSWRNRHGQDWVTPVTNQLNCGSCWAFAATGATELIVNLYFNQHLDLNLSEQYLLSCSGAGSCDGGSSLHAIQYIIDSGIVNEACFPYEASDILCEGKCNNPSEVIQISSRSYFSSIVDTMKKYIINGASAISVTYWSHALTLVGYKVLAEGDSIFVNNNGIISWIIINDGDNLIGQTAWLCKNSWSKYWGDKGYVYIIGNEDQLAAIGLSGPVYSLNYTDAEILCVDSDRDGYYNWGIGQKPAHCPECPDEPDGDDSNPCKGPIDEYGNLNSIIPPPSVEDLVVTLGEVIPDLVVAGENILWYSNQELDSIVCVGNSFTTGKIDIGIYSYYVTQKISGCESNPSEIKLKILPTRPLSDNIKSCEGEESITMSAIGENIRWYNANDNLIFDMRDNQIYKSIQIGAQIWMQENLNVYTNSGSWYYNNDSISYAGIYGRLYDWFTANTSCPNGWHLPSVDDWSQLSTYLGGNVISGGKMKEEGFEHWKSPNTGATNESGFNALPAGLRYPNGDFWNLMAEAGFWASNNVGSYSSFGYLWYSREDFVAPKLNSVIDAGIGHSVRCLKENDPPLIEQDNLELDLKNLDGGQYVFYVTQTINDIESLPDTVYLLIQNKIDFDLGDDITACSGSTVPLDAGSGFDSYLWSTGETTQTIEVSTSNTYSVTITKGVCLASDSILVTFNYLTVNPLSRPVGSASGTTTFTVSSNIDWSVSESSGWLQATKTNSTTLTVEYGENTGIDTRSASIILSGDGVSPQVVIILQEGEIVTTIVDVFEKSIITIYPNPATDKFFIKSSTNIKHEIVISIYDNNGKLVYSDVLEELLTNNLVEIDISNLADGTYFMQLNDSKSIKIKKIIKL